MRSFGGLGHNAVFQSQLDRDPVGLTATARACTRKHGVNEFHG